jgi:hypothetical protein
MSANRSLAAGSDLPMHDRYVRIRDQLLTASTHCIVAMRERLASVPLLEKSEIAYRACAMIRRAHADGQLHLPLRGDLEDAIAMLLVLGVAVIHD